MLSKSVVDGNTEQFQRVGMCRLTGKNQKYGEGFIKELLESHKKTVITII